MGFQDLLLGTLRYGKIPRNAWTATDCKRDAHAKICLSIVLSIQEKTYIFDIGGPKKATEFLNKHLDSLDMHGFFIYLMADNNTGVENFLAGSLTERFIKTIVLNLRESVGGKLMIDVFIKHYYTKNRRILISILGSFVEKRFLLWDSSSRKMIRYREAHRKIELNLIVTSPTQPQYNLNLNCSLVDMNMTWYLSLLPPFQGRFHWYMTPT